MVKLVLLLLLALFCFGATAHSIEISMKKCGSTIRNGEAHSASYIRHLNTRLLDITRVEKLLYKKISVRLVACHSSKKLESVQEGQTLLSQANVLRRAINLFKNKMIALFSEREKSLSESCFGELDRVFRTLTSKSRNIYSNTHNHCFGVTTPGR